VSAAPKILAFGGTTRTEALNKKLIWVAAAAAKAAGGDVTLIDLRDFPMPLYDGDLEAKEGIPPNGVKFKELMLAHRGLLLSTGEYNSSVTGVLKNAIDWASRSAPGEAELACYKDKVVALLAASPGMLGGMRGMMAVRSILGNIGALVIPEQMALPRAHEAFEADGSLKDPKRKAAVERVTSALVKILTKLEA
jgi:NAD(P)H-dependent FMN reductase